MSASGAGSDARGARLAQIFAGTVPNPSALGGATTAEDHFRRGLEWLLAGVRAELEAPPAP